MSRSSMEPPPPPLAGYTSKKRVFMDAEVIEISPPISRTPKLPKQKEVIHYEVIDVDNYEDCADVMVLDEKVDTRNKGKAIKHDYDGSGHYQPKEALTNHLFGLAGVETFGLVNGVGSSESSAPVSDNLINLDSDLSYEDENIDIYNDDIMDFDQYTILQAHFDSMDIPAGVEATVPWYPDFGQSKKKTVTGSDSFYTQGPMQSDHGIDPSLSSWSSKPTPIGALSNSGGVDLSSPWSLSHTAYSNQNQAASQHIGNSLNHPSAVESSESWQLLQPKTVASSGSTNYSNVKKLDAMKVKKLNAMTLPFGVEPPCWGHNPPISVKEYSIFPPQMVNHPPVVEPSMTWWQKPLKSNFKSVFGNYTTHSSVYDPFDDVHIPPEDEHHIDRGQDFPINPKIVDEDDILRKFQIFKKFDTVEDHSDHHYASRGSSMKQPSKNWAKKIQEEWRILEKDLPDTIFVRVYESRMDLLRAVIVGAEGTPYHDGLFFFDVLFPDAYPHVPPHVYYHSGGLRLNPNLYSCGKVCLSLLNTWSGNKNEMWIPGMSTMLQVLVSIQALILNQKPFFNEPGYAGMSGSANGELRSQQYNESTFILSLKTMLYTMRKPPKHFNDFVVGHFYKRAHDILVACKAYMDGAQVGCLVKGGVQDVDEGDKSCSKKFKDSLAGYVNTLVKEFTQIGAKDCEKFLTQAKKGNKRVGDMPNAAK